MMKILIAGSGKMGADIFNYLTAFDFSIIWLCVNEEEADKRRLQFNKRINRQFKSGVITEVEYNALLERVQITDNQAKATESDLIIEAIWEDLDSKRELVDALRKYTPAHALFTTNTSSIPLRAIFQDSDLMKRACGLHFFYPILFRDLVEVNLTNEFSVLSHERLTKFIHDIQRKAILLPEEENFLLNRILLPVQAEAVRLLNEGIADHRLIDGIVRSRLFPIGIFEFFDHVGLDVMYTAVKNYSQAQTEISRYDELIRHLHERADQGLLGIKAGRGYYKYPLSASFFDTESFKDSKSDTIAFSLEKSFYESIHLCMKNSGVQPAQLDLAMSEYWGVEFSFIEKGRSKGFLM